MGCVQCDFTGVVHEYDKTAGPGFVDIPCPDCVGVASDMPDAIADLHDTATQAEIDEVSRESQLLTQGGAMQESRLSRSRSGSERSGDARRAINQITEGGSMAETGRTREQVEQLSTTVSLLDGLLVGIEEALGLREKEAAMTEPKEPVYYGVPRRLDQLLGYGMDITTRLGIVRTAILALKEVVG